MHPLATPPETLHPSGSASQPAACLNCGEQLHGAYCAQCGQRSVDLSAPTWHVAKEAFAEAIDVDSRVLRTARALCIPGRLTTEFLCGRRIPYIGPAKLFLLAGTVLTSTWIITRGVDAHFYNIAPDNSAGAYIDRVVRGSLAASIAVTSSSWLLAFRRRRLLDDAIFSLHLVAALILWATAIVWLGTAWKLAWGTATAVPSSLPPLPFLLFVPAVVLGLAYIVVAVHRVYRRRWWVTAVRAALIAIAGAAAVRQIISRTS